MIKYFSLFSIAAIIGLTAGVIHYIITPREYALDGTFQSARVNHQFTADMFETQSLIQSFTGSSNDIKTRLFRINEFDFTVKFRSKNLTSILKAPQELIKIFDEKYHEKYHYRVDSKTLELRSIKTNRENLSKALNNHSKAPSKSLSEIYYHYQIQFLLTEFNKKQLEAELYLSPEMTRYFAFIPYAAQTDKAVYPNFFLSLLVPLVISQIVAFLAMKLQSFLQRKQNV